MSFPAYFKGVYSFVFALLQQKWFVVTRILRTGNLLLLWSKSKWSCWLLWHNYRQTKSRWTLHRTDARWFQRRSDWWIYFSLVIFDVRSSSTIASAVYDATDHSWTSIFHSKSSDPKLINWHASSYTTSVCSSSYLCHRQRVAYLGFGDRRVYRNQESVNGRVPGRLDQKYRHFAGPTFTRWSAFFLCQSKAVGPFLSQLCGIWFLDSGGLLIDDRVQPSLEWIREW